jgi:uracil phosphoribosyltransferase
MQTVVADHPLIAQKLTEMRDVSTPNEVFRRLTDELVQLLGYEATRHLPVQATTVQTPVGTAEGVMITAPPPLLVPVLRAGLGLLAGMSRLLPSADVGFVGMVRDETTLIASSYAQRLPTDLSGRDTFVLDPMLATGGTMEATIRMLLDRGAASVTAVCLVAAPEGIDRVTAAFADAEPDRIRVVTAAIDPELNQHGYIVPGLGDAGDRLFGPAE